MPRIAICLLALSALPSPAHAQVERSGGAGNAQLTQQLQQLASERTQLQGDNTRLKQELAAMRKELDALKGAHSADERRLRAFEGAALRAGADRDSSQRELELELEQARERMQELVAKFRETAGSLRDVESEKAALTGTLTRREAELKSCAEHNLKLFDINNEILARLEDRGFWSAVSSAEPFTRLKRVELDNLTEEYRGKAEDHLLQQPASR